MTYTPKSAPKILQELKGLTLARTPLNDILPGSVLNTILNAVAQELGSVERSILAMREGFFLNTASGSELTERIAELPPAGITRLDSAPAAGAVLRFERVNTVGSLEIPAGSTVASTAGNTYFVSQTVQFPNGANYIDNVYCVATSKGSQTNAEINTIVRLVSLPAGVVSVTNTVALTNGVDEESDEDLKVRAAYYLQSLSRCQRAALQFMALSFRGEQGERFRYASIFEDVEVPGYTELVLDDGTGIDVQSVSVQGKTTSGVLSNTGFTLLYHESPATAPITPQNIVITRDGGTVTLNAADFVSIPERGLLYVKQGVLQAGDSWQLSGYRVFTGLIAEIQREIEGDYSNPSVLTGFRAAGTRVVATVPVKQLANFDVSIQVDLGYSYAAIESQVRSALANFVSTLPPGSTLFVSAMVEQARAIPGLRDIIFYGRNSTQRLENIYPETKKSAIRIDNQSITITQIGA